MELCLPKLYLDGFPKAGLHLAVRYVLGLGLTAHDYEYNWVGTNPWTVQRANLHTWAPNINKLQEGEYTKGHTGWLQTIEMSLIMQKIGVLFIYRDLRDVVVSQTYHIMNPDNEKAIHPGKAAYEGMTKEEVMLAVIEGNGEYDGIIPRWETYAPWLDSDWALPLRYEEMLANPYATANKIYDYALEVMQAASGAALVVPDKFRKAVVVTMMKLSKETHLSATFRKGGSGGWRNEFTPAVTEAFKAHENGWLARLGYEKDDRWQ